MSVTSLAFVGFVLVAFIIYHLIPGKWKKFWLLAMSLTFYATWAWQFVLVGLGVAALNFWLGHRLAKKPRSITLWGGIGFNLAALLVLKYFDFFVNEFASSFGVSNLAGVQILLPVGLSYYVLQTISYLVDVYRGQLKPSSNIIEFSIYLLYFPKLLAGPLENAREFLPKIESPQVVDNQTLRKSAALILLGLFRKIFVADTLAALTPPDVFTQPQNYAGQILLVWIIVYSFTLYNDFAGYSNIARGVSGLFGIELITNFSRPHYARNFTEFWQRWHISLSNWLRDYVYFPASRFLARHVPNRRSVVHSMYAPMVTMLVSGVWHGLSWHMIVWGGLHGGYQVYERIRNNWKALPPPDKWTPRRQGAARWLVYGLATFAWIFFVSELNLAISYVVGLFQWVGPDWRLVKEIYISQNVVTDWQTWLFPDLRILIPLIPILILDHLQERSNDEIIFLKWSPWAQAFGAAFVLLAIGLAAGGDASAPFVYQGF